MEDRSEAGAGAGADAGEVASGFAVPVLQWGDADCAAAHVRGDTRATPGREPDETLAGVAML